MNELWIILRWYFACLVYQFIGLGLLQPVFHNWKDRGYGIARLVGLVAAAMPLWFIASLRIIPFNTATVIIFTILLAGLSLWLLVKYKFNFNRYMLLQEVIFAVIFWIWCLIRSTNSRVEGTEKMMNIAFMNSINLTEYFPPNDPWYAGSTINYYYLGHYAYTFLAKFAGVAISYAYNLAMNTIIAQTFIGTMSIIGEMTGLIKKHYKLGILLGIFVAMWLCFGSNMHYAYSWVKQVIFDHQTFSYWFPDGTRIIPYAIDEFPAYSVTLGDLHGHYMGMPFITLFVGFLLVSFKMKLNSKKKIIMNCLLSFILFTLYGTNSWDFITVNFLFLLLHIYQTLRFTGNWKQKLSAFILAEGSLILPGIPMILPFILRFKPAVSGIGLVPLNTYRELLPYLLMWGMFLLINIFGIITFLMVVKLRKTSIKHEISTLIKQDHAAVFAFMLCFAAVCLIIGVEILYVRDIFDASNPPYFRTNTVFKFYYAAWNLWALGSGYIIYATIKAIFKNPWKFAFFYLSGYATILLLTWFGSVCYILEAVGDFYSWSKFEDGSNLSVAGLLEGKTATWYKTLDGNAYINDTATADYNIIQWLHENIKGTPIVLEAVGDAYTYYARISANTGLPTVVGWPTHEWQWRNDTEETFQRKYDVETMYTTNDAKTFLDLSDLYKVDYIVVSDLEVKAYGKNGKLDTSLIEQYYNEVYNYNGSKIYQYKYLKSN